MVLKILSSKDILVLGKLPIIIFDSRYGDCKFLIMYSSFQMILESLVSKISVFSSDNFSRVHLFIFKAFTFCKFNLCFIYFEVQFSMREYLDIWTFDKGHFHYYHNCV